MKIDISSLLNNRLSSIPLDDDVIIPHEMLSNSRIDELDNVHIKGKIKMDEEDMLELLGSLSGVMHLKDDVTLEPVLYDFKVDIEEILEKNEKLLDITEILWQNILMEVPSKVRSSFEDIELSGDGWRVISEDKFNEEMNKADNPFATLENLLEKKEEK